MGAYESAFDRIVSPALDGFKPDIIFVASGFDGSAFDPLGRMMMHSKGYASLTKKLMAAADRLCNGRLVMAHEGGYSPTYVPFCGLAVLEALSGKSSGVDDPFWNLLRAWQVKICNPIRKNLLQSWRNKLATLRAIDVLHCYGRVTFYSAPNMCCFRIETCFTVKCSCANR